jgi:hypothetical protein
MRKDLNEMIESENGVGGEAVRRAASQNKLAQINIHCPVNRLHIVSWLREFFVVVVDIVVRLLFGGV